MAAPAAAGSGGSYWLGPSFNGLPLTATIDRGLPAYVYGDCTPHSDTGCTPPVEAQNWTTCDRNPLALDVLPTRLFRVRGGGIAAQYREEGVDVGIGRRTVAVFAGDEGLAIAAARLLRLRSASAPPARFRRPAYPRAVLAELARVVAPRGRHHSVRAI